MLQLIVFSLLSCFTLSTTSAQEKPLNVEDFQPLSGLYTGTLTYTDYQSEAVVTMPLLANLTVKNNDLNFNIEINEGGKRYAQNYTYTVQNGSLKGFNIIENEMEQGRLIFGNKGRDDNRPAEFRHTAVMNEQGLRITKEVRFLDEPGEEFFIRNQYTYVRIDEMNTQTDGYAEIDGSDAAMANVSIAAGQEFLLGEYSNGGYKVKLSGQGGDGIEVIVISKATKEQTQGFGLAPYGKATVQIKDGEMVILRNDSKKDTTIRVKMSKTVEGMRYRDVE